MSGGRPVRATALLRRAGSALGLAAAAVALSLAAAIGSAAVGAATGGDAPFTGTAQASCTWNFAASYWRMSDESATDQGYNNSGGVGVAAAAGYTNHLQVSVSNAATFTPGVSTGCSGWSWYGMFSTSTAANANQTSGIYGRYYRLSSGGGQSWTGTFSGKSFQLANINGATNSGGSTAQGVQTSGFDMTNCSGSTADSANFVSRTTSGSTAFGVFGALIYGGGSSCAVPKGPDVVSITVDYTRPVSSTSTAAAYSTSRTVSHTVATSDATSGVNYVNLFYSAVGGTPTGSETACSGTSGTVGGSSTIAASVTLACTLPADGTYYFYSRSNDRAGNRENVPAAFDDSIVVDTVAPSVSSFTSAVASPTASTSIAYALTFDESVTGLAGADFANAGTATGCVFTPSASSGGSVTVTVTGCGASGTLRPRLLANTLSDLAGNSGPAANSDATTTLTLDRVPPVVSSFTSAVASPTASTSIAYALTFDESVTGLAGADFANAGTATGCAFGVSGSGASYTVTVTGCGTSGTLAPRLAASSVADLLGNAGPVSATTGSSLTLDREGPVISAITPGSGALTNLSAYPVGFSAVDAVAGMGATYVARSSAAVSGSACGAGWSAYGTETAAGSGFVSVGIAHATCYRWRIRAVDALGNETTAVSGALLVDQVAPVINAFLLGDGSGLSTTAAVAASVTATDALSGVTGVRWSTDAGYDWSVTPWLPYTGNRAPTLTLGDGAGDYGVAVQVRDAAGNIATSGGVIGLQTTTRMPQLVLGARIVDCAAPGNTLSVNSSGTVYWPVGRDLCLVPLPTGSGTGSKTVAGVTYTGSMTASGPLSFTLVSGNPCVAPCTGVVGRFPTDAYGQARLYSAGSASTYLRLRLDRETTDAATSLTAVSLVVRVTVTVTWSAPGHASTTETYSAILQLQVRSLATGQRPG